LVLLFRVNQNADSGSRARGAGVFDRRGNRKYLNGAERRAFLQAVKNEPDALCRAFGLTLFYTGCRISEALNLTAERTDLAGKNFVFETLKRRRRGYFRAVLWRSAKLSRVCSDKLSQRLEAEGAGSSFQGVEFSE
jgi:integrase